MNSTLPKWITMFSKGAGRSFSDSCDWIKTFTDADKKDDRWITVKSNGEHILIGKGGEIKAGLGGKFTGQKISGIKNKPTDKTPPPKQPTKPATVKSTLSTDTKKNPQSLISGGSVKKDSKEALAIQYAAMKDRLDACKTYEEFKTFKKEHKHTFKSGLITDDASPNTCYLPGGDNWLAEKDMMSGYLDTVKVVAGKGATLPAMQLLTKDSERKYLNRDTMNLINDPRNYNGICGDRKNIVLKRPKNDLSEVANEYQKGVKSSKSLHRTLTHEIGHTIDKDFSFKYNGKQYTTDSMMGLGEDFIKKNVSSYGTTNKRECMAECFSRYVGWKNGADKKPSDFALAVAEGMLKQREKE
ncbi:MAG: hypothetical protein LBH05_07825 [Deferribacteraceae bacterium]|jgi:hypothetical protein|nr:hypothetical protein [Deferribacteraceae bacterium]